LENFHVIRVRRINQIAHRRRSAEHFRETKVVRQQMLPALQDLDRK